MIIDSFIIYLLSSIFPFFIYCVTVYIYMLYILLYCKIGLFLYVIIVLYVSSFLHTTQKKCIYFNVFRCFVFYLYFNIGLQSIHGGGGGVVIALSVAVICLFTWLFFIRFLYISEDKQMDK